MPRKNGPYNPVVDAGVELYVMRKMLKQIKDMLCIEIFKIDLARQKKICRVCEKFHSKITKLFMAGSECKLFLKKHRPRWLVVFFILKYIYLIYEVCYLLYPKILTIFGLN